MKILLMKLKKTNTKNRTTFLEECNTHDFFLSTVAKIKCSWNCIILIIYAPIPLIEMHF